MDFETPKTGVSAPEQKTPEKEKEENKEYALKVIREILENINIGSYVADKEWDAAHGEDLFGAPRNLEEIMVRIENMISLSYMENWPRERFIKELSQIKLNFDFSIYKKYDSFSAFYDKEEPLGRCLNFEYIADMLYHVAIPD